MTIPDDGWLFRRSWWRCFSPFFFNDPATTGIHPLSLHDARPISPPVHPVRPLFTVWANRRLASGPMSQSRTPYYATIKAFTGFGKHVQP